MNRIAVGIALFIALCGGGAISAQEGEATPDAAPLMAEAVEIVAGVGMFEQPIQTVIGRIVNTSDAPQTLFSIDAAAFARDDSQIAEGFGVPVNACGIGLLDVTLNAGESVAFSVPLEFFGAESRIARVEVRADGIAADADAPPTDLVDGIRQVFAGEAVSVEFHAELGMLFAAGCARDPFWAWDWYSVDPASTRAPAPITYPALDVTTPDELAERLRFNEPEIWDRAFVRFAPDSRRFVFQDAVNTVYTAAIPGNLIRPLHSRLNNRTLQGVYWLPEGRFLAYYYGAIGDPVIYFTADVEGRFISGAPWSYPASEIVPGVTADARRVIVAADFTDVRGTADSSGTGMGYYLLVLTTGFYDKLFDALPPGNNAPNPVPITDPVENLVTQVYVVLNGDSGTLRLACYDRAADTLSDLGALPFTLADDERARMWLTPDESRLVIAASGRRGGVWTIPRAGAAC